MGDGEIVIVITERQSPQTPRGPQPPRGPQTPRERHDLESPDVLKRRRRAKSAIPAYPNAGSGEVHR